MIPEPMKNFMTHSQNKEGQGLAQLQYYLTILTKHLLRCTFLFCVFILLTGCNPASDDYAYQIIYSQDLEVSGNRREDKPHPIAQSDMMIFSKYSKENGSTLCVQDADGNDVLAFEDVTHSGANRGMVDSDILWITTESWGKGNFGVYRDSALLSSQIIAVDLDTNETILNKEMKNDDLFLFVNDGYCYFYDRGKAPGKWIDNSVKANIYYRHIDSWDETVQVHQFDYAGRPTDVHSSHTLQFHLQPDSFSVVLDLRYVNDQNEWANRSLWSVEIPFVIPE